MKRIDKNIELNSVKIDDQEQLFKLMNSIYVPVYVHLWKDSGKKYLEETYSKEGLKRELENRNSNYFFVTYSNRLAGIFKFIIDSNHAYGDEESKSVMLHRIYLAKFVQGKGVGTSLINWLENEIRSDYMKVWLEVMDTQLNVIRFYEKLGYSMVGKTRLQSENIIEQYKGMFVMSKMIIKIKSSIKYLIRSI